MAITNVTQMNYHGWKYILVDIDGESQSDINGALLDTIPVYPFNPSILMTFSDSTITSGIDSISLGELTITRSEYTFTFSASSATAQYTTVQPRTPLCVLLFPYIYRFNNSSYGLPNTTPPITEAFTGMNQTEYIASTKAQYSGGSIQTSPASNTLGVLDLYGGHVSEIYHGGFLQEQRTTNAVSVNSDFNDLLKEIVEGSEEYDPDNPYAGGDSQYNPGTGEFNYSGDTIGIPDLPTISVCDSGFVSLYAPTETQLKSLADFMWSDTFSLDSFKKLFNNPMDCILGLSIIPVNVPTGSAEEITIGNVVSTVSCNKVTSQFVTVDCGTITISPTKFTASFLDYSPYTKCYVYLPFIGMQQINVDDVMGATLHVAYHVDLLTGACVCYLEAINRISGGIKSDDAVLYTFMGQCAESVPLSSTDFSNTIGSILNAAGAAAGVVATVASGGLASPMLGSSLTGLAGAAANSALSLKPNIQRSGSLGGASGFMNIRFPYIIFDCPNTAAPTQQRFYTGYPSNEIAKLSSLSGFNVIQAINLSVAGANDSELAEIKSILLEGVII